MTRRWPEIGVVLSTLFLLAVANGTSPSVDFTNLFDNLCVKGGAKFAAGELKALSRTRLPSDFRELIASVPIGDDKHYRGRVNRIDATLTHGAYYKITRRGTTFFAAVETWAKAGDPSVRRCSVSVHGVAPWDPIQTYAFPQGDDTQILVSKRTRGYAEWYKALPPSTRLRLSLQGEMTMLQSIVTE